MADTINRKRKLDRSVISKLYHNVPSQNPIRISFLKRLATFDVFNWAGKPVNPPQCAKYGWQIAGKDVLKCVMCHQFLSVELPSPTKTFSYKEACSRLKSRLTTGHSKFCLFSTNPPADDSVMEIEHLTNVELLDNIQNQLLDLKKIDFQCEITKPEEVTEVFNWLTDTIELPNIHLSGFFLVLTGWLYMKQEMLLKCDYCNRRWSLEPYILHHQLSTSDNKNQAQAVVDPVGQHQRWCAWRSSITESGWESRLSQLLQLKECRCQGKRSRLSTETSASLTDSMRAVRKLLNGTL